ncbi:unnamed protein product, partial [marine sediment metagenome]
MGAVPAAFEAKQLAGFTWASPGTIGSSAPNTGAFTIGTFGSILVSDTMGIGDTTPDSALEVVSAGDNYFMLSSHAEANGDILIVDSAGNMTATGSGTFNTIKATGNGLIWSDGTTGATPTSGAGRRMMWIPAKFAFRAGAVSRTHWNNTSIGSYSVAFGHDTRASGE